ncbi:MAG: OmpA family protein [Alcaligenaceae bacterium]|nr:OmpA family protein [Alcaligenaceae bacterium]
MKFFQNKAKIAAIVTSLLLVACGNISKVDQHGMTDEPVWPSVDRVTFHNKMGTFPDLTSLKEVKAGMTKDQLYYLLGRPHFGEGFVGVREWDYLFHFHTPGQGTNDVTTCQFKALFDRDVFTRSFFWKAVDPAEAVCPPGAQGPQRYTIAANALFAFDKADISSMRAEGRRQLDDLATTIQSFDDLKAVTVYGYTDLLGDASYNQGLSQRRADTVRNYLVQRGVPSHLISAQGMGETQPVKQCDSQQPRNEYIACLEPNRRVEISVDGSGQVKK